jgi:ribonuclease P protein component
LRLDSLAVTHVLQPPVELSGRGPAPADRFGPERESALAEAGTVLLPHISVSVQHPERLGREHRLLNSREYAAVKAGATSFRGRCALLLVLPCPGEATRVGFVASKRGVGGAVQRNRARRRLREIVRRRWARVAPEGYWMMFIASRAVLDASHERLATEVESLLASAGILDPVAVAGG